MSKNVIVNILYINSLSLINFLTKKYQQKNKTNLAGNVLFCLSHEDLIIFYYNVKIKFYFEVKYVFSAKI